MDAALSALSSRAQTCSREKDSSSSRQRRHGDGWNWVPSGVLSMDKGTVRGLIGAKIFKVQVQTKGGPQIAEFSPAGLKLDQVRQACGLTPKKPST